MDLEGRFSLSTIHTICKEYEKISHQAVKVLQKKKNLGRISHDQLKEVAYSLQTCSQTVEKLKTALIERQKQILDTNSQEGVVHKVFGSVVQGTTSLGLNLLTSDEPAWLDDQIKRYRTELYSLSNSTVASEFSLMVGKFVTSMLEEEILHIDEREPVLRGSFLKDLFYEEGVANPAPSMLGGVVISLLKNRRELMEKLIAVNLMKGFTNLYDRFQTIENNDRDFFANFVLKCMETGSEHIDDTEKADIHGLEYTVGKEERKKFLSGTTPRSLGQAILKFGFPNGHKDLIFILPDIFTDQVKEKLYKLMSDGLDETLFNAFKDMSSNQTLKESLVLEGFRSVEKVFEDSSNKSTQIQPPRNFIQTLVDPKRPALATAGIVFVFFQVLFSTLGSVFKEALNIRNLFATPKEPDPLEERINNQIYSLLSPVIKASSSTLVRFLFKVRGRRFVETLGSSLTVKLRDMKISDLLTLQLESILTSTLAPGGSWEGVGDERKYVGGEIPKMPRTVGEERKLEQEKREAQEELHKQLKNVKNGFAKSISGLIGMIVTSLSFKPKLQVNPNSSRFQHAIASLERRIVNFANSCIEKVITLLMHILKADRVLHQIGKSTYNQTKMIQQDGFILAVTEFARVNLVKSANK